MKCIAPNTCYQSVAKWDGRLFTVGVNGVFCVSVRDQLEQFEAFLKK